LEANLAKRLTQWITFDILFALIPFMFTVLLRYLAGSLSVTQLSESPEILFFAIMVCATTTGDLHELFNPIRWDTRLRILFSFMLFGAIFSSVLYGSFLYDTLIGSNSELFKQNLFQVSIYLTLSLTLVALLVQILIARVEEQSRAKPRKNANAK
jgi:hypothetical protein